MMDAIIEFFNYVLAFFSNVGLFFTTIWAWLQSGIYDFFTEWFSAFMIWSTIGMIQFQMWAVTFAWDVAQHVLDQLNISSALSAAWSQLDNQVLNALTFFNVPDAINVLLSARVTRFVLNFMHL